MRKISSLVLAGCMAFLLCACSENTAAPAETEAVKETQAVSEAVKTETETTPQAGTEAAAAEEEGTAAPAELLPAAEPLSLLVSTFAEAGQADNNYIIYTTLYPDVHFSGEEAGAYGKLAETMNRDTEILREVVAESRNSFPEMIRDEMYDDIYFNGFSHYIVGNVLRSDTNAVSIKHDYDGYFGGSHGEYSVTSYNYDPATGEYLRLSDVVKDTDGFMKAVREKLEAIGVEYFGLEESLSSYDLSAVPEDPSAKAMNFAMGHEALILWFNPEELAPYSAGIQEVILPYNTYGSLFQEKYMVSCGEYFEPVDEYMEYPAGNGTFIFAPSYNEYGTVTGLKVTLNGNTETFETYTYKTEPYLVKNDGKYYLYVFGNADDDEKFLEVIDLNGEKAAYVEKLPLCIFMEYEEQNVPDAPQGVNVSCTKVTAHPLIRTDEFFLKAKKNEVSYHVGENGAPEKN